MNNSQPNNTKSGSLKKTLVDIVVPVHNDAHVIPASIRKLTTFLSKHFPYDYRVIIVENGSSDNSWQVAEAAAKDYPKVRAMKLDEAGRGRALKYAWSQSNAAVVAYMDVDLSTDLSALEPMITPLVRGEFDIATGSRLHKTSKITRRFNREVISRVYNYIMRTVLDLRTSDVQCGFKAMRSELAQKILPTIKDNVWFFDSELLVKAERQGLVVHEVAVTWYEDPDSRVKIVKTTIDNLRGIRRLRKEFDSRPRWEKRVFVGLLAVTAVAYFIGMTRNGYANSFYAAAVQAGTHSWKAFFYGSLDSANFISVDKPPVFLWVMELFTRALGFHAWSMLLPNVLAGVGSVGLVYVTVRRWFSGKSALLAAGIMAMTPVAVMMFGYNNPDSLLTLLLLASVYSFIRAIEGRWPLIWLTLSGVLIGLAFNTKMLQALLILPVLAVVYLYGAPFPLLKRLKHLLIVTIPTAVVALCWPVIVWLTPATARPYIGSSGDNNIWNLIFGYNGLARFEGGTQPAANQPISFGGQKGILRMFNAGFGPGIAWFIGFALIGLLLILWLRRSAKRTDKVRIAIAVFGGWLIIHMIIFSLLGGTIHPYYAVVMAPAIAALSAISLPYMINQYRHSSSLAFVLPLAIAITGIIACILLGYYANWLPWLRWLVLDLSILAAAGLLLNLAEPRPKLFLTSITIAGLSCTLSPLSISLATLAAGHSGATPLVGPTGVAAQTLKDQITQSDITLSQYLLTHRDGAKWLVAVTSSADSAPLQIASNQPVMAIGGFDGSDNALSLAQFKTLIKTKQLRYYATSSLTVASSGQANSQIFSYIQSHGRQVNYPGGSSFLLYRL